jgi:hypothetical protein
LSKISLQNFPDPDFGQPAEDGRPADTSGALGFTVWPLPGGNPGLPYIFWNMGMQMLQQPDKITILYDADHEVRRVRMNEPHPAQVTPSWYGNSVGHYEGDTLVIDTIGVKTGRPFAVVDWFGTPYTEALHVVERYRLLDYEAAKEALERSTAIGRNG